MIRKEIIVYIIFMFLSTTIIAVLPIVIHFQLLASKIKADTTISHSYDVDQTSYLISEDTKKEMTSVTFGSSDEDVLFSIDMSGHHKIKKVIIVEEK